MPRTVKLPQSSPDLKAALSTLPSPELDIYNRLLAVKNILLGYKKNQNFTLTEVSAQSDEISALSIELNNIRQGKSPLPDGKSSDHLDSLFTLCHQLLLECFAVVGDKVAPSLLPIYNQLISIQTGLEILKISGFFTLDDVQVYQRRLNEIENQYVQDGKFMIEGQIGIMKGQAVLFSKLHYCYRLTNILTSAIDVIDDELLPIQEKLVLIHADLQSLLSNSKTVPVPSSHLTDIQYQLNAIDDQRREDGNFVSTSGRILKGQELVTALLENCYESLGDAVLKNETLDEHLHELFQDLASIYERLEQLLERRWEVRPQDLIQYQRLLHKIENQKVNGIFYGNSVSKDKIPPGQATLHHLLHKCHRLIYTLQSALDPIVDPAIQGIHHHLIAVRKCLLQLRHFGGPFSDSDLYPFQLKLAGFDNLRKEGKFLVDGEVVRGQGVLHALLEECYDILNELKAESDE